MEAFIQYTVQGLAAGGFYALAALGLAVIFGALNVVNFAHGAVVGIGAMLGWWFLAVLQWPFWLAAVGVVIAGAVVGLVVNQVAVAPLAKAPPIAALLATFAVSMVLDRLSQLVFGPDTRAFPAALPTDNLRIGGLRLGTSDVAMLVTTLVVMVALVWFLRSGRHGRAIRATAQDPDAAVQMGVPVARVRAPSSVGSR